MATSRFRRNTQGSNYWPGFVDAMATLLLVMTFLLSVFMLAQYFVTREVSGKDAALQKLNAQIAELSELLSLEKSAKQSLEANLASISASLDEERGENKRLTGLISTRDEHAKDISLVTAALETEVKKQKNISAGAMARVELLNQQLAALRRQIAALNEALEASEKRQQEGASAKISDLSKRINVALARRVQELSRYRSDFFGSLRKLLGNRADIRIVGDRFVFQSEVLFSSGSAEVNDAGKRQLDKLASALVSLNEKIPSSIHWVLRVDGHTDDKPIFTQQFPSNWELSVARALSVVRYLIGAGVPPERLVAAGFGQFSPIDTTDTPGAKTRNRRIEFKLTEK
jgi:chemotaxis protein MotB